MNICLFQMTRPLMRQFFQEFTYDPDTIDGEKPQEQYIYSQAKADAFFEKHDQPDQLHFAVMCGEEIVGSLYLKQISLSDRSCSMSIHMKNDSVKNRGYGTRAEQLALTYAFEKLRLETVYANALTKNARSRHVLEKVGFKEIRHDGHYSYYACSRADWQSIRLQGVSV